MAPLDTGRFIITNSKFKNAVYLADANSCSDLHGDWQQNRPGEMWHVVLLSNGNYTIMNHGYGSYATCEYIAKADAGDNIVGGGHQQQWKIIEDDGNSHVICPTRNGHVYWHLADGESGTPITLEHYSRTKKIRWEFRQVEDAEGSGAVGGGETGRVHGNDDGPAFPVLLPTPVQVATSVEVPTAVQAPTPDLPTLASASSLTSESLISPKNLSYYSIGVAGTDQYLGIVSSNRVEPYTPRWPWACHWWLITKRGDNWLLESQGKYLRISKYGEGHVSNNLAELSLTPVGGPNEFRITDMDSGQSWDGLVFTHLGKSTKSIILGNHV